jgi:hypothetical protein
MNAIPKRDVIPLKARIILFRQELCPGLSGDIRSFNGELPSSVVDLIKANPLHHEEIHLWEFGMPGRTAMKGTLLPRQAADPGGCDGTISKPGSGSLMMHRLREQLLAGYMDGNPADSPMARGLYGALLCGTPPYPVSISSSSTCGWALVAISRGYRVGVDIEKIDTTLGLMEIAERFFRSEEWDYLRSCPLEMRATAFFWFWTLKEAYLKVIGTGWQGWRTLPDFTPLIREHFTLPGQDYQVHGGYTAHIESTSSLTKALVYRRTEHASR